MSVPDPFRVCPVWFVFSCYAVGIISYYYDYYLKIAEKYARLCIKMRTDELFRIVREAYKICWCEKADALN